VKDVVFRVNGDDLAGRNAETHGAVADAMNETRKAGIADDAECGARRAHGRRRWIVPGVKENRFNDIHRTFRGWPHVPLRAQRCGCATYAVGNASASSEQTTRSGKEHAKQEGQDSAGDGTEPMKKFLLATVSMVALTSVSRATDMPAAMPAKSPMYMPAPVSDWTGLYIGVQGGVARRDASFEVSGNALSRWEQHRRSSWWIGRLQFATG
jgi:hypothetical protein